jgi:hypothetical protein
MARVKDAAIDLHNKYDSMSVKELIDAIIVDSRTIGMRGYIKSGHYPALESALRKAAVKEESVGEVLFTTDKDGLPIAVGVTEVKSGTFRLVPATQEAKHLCLTCQETFAECKSNPTFGSETDDRVVACDSYEPKVIEEKAP